MCLSCTSTFFSILIICAVHSRLGITHVVTMRIGYNVVSRGTRIFAARGKMGATANNNAVINCHLFL